MLRTVSGGHMALCVLTVIIVAIRVTLITNHHIIYIFTSKIIASSAIAGAHFSSRGKSAGEEASEARSPRSDLRKGPSAVSSHHSGCHPEFKSCSAASCLGLCAHRVVSDRLSLRGALSSERRASPAPCSLEGCKCLAGPDPWALSSGPLSTLAFL